jgi:hypothetical protein
MLTTAFAAKAEWVSGYVRSTGTYVQPYYRTPANGTPYDNLNYRGYPSQQPGYVSPHTWGPNADLNRPKVMPSYGSTRFEVTPLPATGDFSPKPLYHRSSALGF